VRKIIVVVGLGVLVGVLAFSIVVASRHLQELKWEKECETLSFEEDLREWWEEAKKLMEKDRRTVLRLCSILATETKKLKEAERGIEELEKVLEELRRHNEEYEKLLKELLEKLELEGPKGGAEDRGSVEPLFWLVLNLRLEIKNQMTKMYA